MKFNRNASDSGTDTSGSSRIPPAYCGILGIRTTYGALSTEHVVPLSPSLDTVGTPASDFQLPFWKKKVNKEISRLLEERGEGKAEASAFSVHPFFALLFGCSSDLSSPLVLSISFLLCLCTFALSFLFCNCRLLVIGSLFFESRQGE
jgi:hypothetical protein